MTLMLCSCTFTTTLSESPDFIKGKENTVKEQVKNLINYSEIIENGSSVSVNGKSQNILSIVIVIDTDLPKSKREVRDLAISIAAAYRDALEDQKQYDTYHVGFASAETSEGVSQSGYNEITVKLTELEKSENSGDQ